MNALEEAAERAKTGRLPRPPEAVPVALSARNDQWKRIPRRFKALRAAMRSLCGGGRGKG